MQNFDKTGFKLISAIGKVASAGAVGYPVICYNQDNRYLRFATNLAGAIINLWYTIEYYQ